MFCASGIRIHGNDKNRFQTHFKRFYRHVYILYRHGLRYRQLYTGGSGVYKCMTDFNTCHYSRLTDIGNCRNCVSNWHNSKVGAKSDHMGILIFLIPKPGSRKRVTIFIRARKSPQKSTAQSMPKICAQNRICWNLGTLISCAKLTSDRWSDAETWRTAIQWAVTMPTWYQQRSDRMAACNVCRFSHTQSDSTDLIIAVVHLIGLTASAYRLHTGISVLALNSVLLLWCYGVAALLLLPIRILSFMFEKMSLLKRKCPIWHLKCRFCGKFAHSPIILHDSCIWKPKLTTSQKFKLTRS